MKLVLLFVFAISAAAAVEVKLPNLLRPRSEPETKNAQNSYVRYLKPGPEVDPTPLAERKYKNMDPRAPQGEAPESSQSRITGGSYAWDTLLPYQAAVTMGYGGGWYGICGGTLIGNEWVVTAAHCVVSNPEYIEIGLGSVDRNNPLHRTWAYQIHVNGNWNSNNLDGDIALLKFPWVDYNERMAPAALPARNGQYSSYVNYWVTASGWGGINDNGDLTNSLKYVVLNVVDNSVCSNTYGSDLGRSSIVCVATWDGQSTCGGDSGGPLVVEYTRLLIGVTSFGAAAGCTLNMPIGFTRVTSYLDWINNVSGISW